MPKQDLKIEGLKRSPAKKFFVVWDKCPNANNYEYSVSDLAGTEIGRNNTDETALSFKELAAQPGKYILIVVASDKKDDGEPARAQFEITKNGITKFTVLAAVPAPAAPKPAPIAPPPPSAQGATTPPGAGAPGTASATLVLTTNPPNPAPAPAPIPAPAAPPKRKKTVRKKAATPAVAAPAPAPVAPVAAATPPATATIPWHKRYQKRIAICAGIIAGSLGLIWLIHAGLKGSHSSPEANGDKRQKVPPGYIEVDTPSPPKPTEIIDAQTGRDEKIGAGEWESAGPGQHIIIAGSSNTFNAPLIVNGPWTSTNQPLQMDGSAPACPPQLTNVPAPLPAPAAQSIPVKPPEATCPPGVPLEEPPSEPPPPHAAATFVPPPIIVQPYSYYDYVPVVPVRAVVAVNPFGSPIGNRYRYPAVRRR